MGLLVVLQLDAILKTANTKVEIRADGTSYDEQMSNIFVAAVTMILLPKVVNRTYNEQTLSQLNNSDLQP